MKKSPARRTWPPIAGLALAGVASLTFLYVKTSTREESSYFENVASLRQMKQLDARWDLDLIRSAVGRDTNYDALVDSLHTIDTLQDSMRTVWMRQSHPSAAMLVKGSAALERAFAAKASLVDQFKSHNSVLRNSLAFLPRAAVDAQSELNRQTHGSPAQVSAEVNKILLSAMLYSEAASPTKANDIRVALDRLTGAGARLGPVARDVLGVFSSHVRTLLREQPLVDELVSEIDAVRPTVFVDELERLLAGEEQEAGVRGDRYHLYLLMFATTLIGLLLYAAYRLIRGHAVVAGVNRDLAGVNTTLALSHSALASKEAEIRSVVEYMADAVITFDESGLIRSANPMVQSIFGYAPGELVLRHVESLVPDLCTPPVDNVHPASTDSLSARAVSHVRGVHRTGTAISLDVSVSEYRVNGHSLRTAIVRDVGRRIATMKALELARLDAENASRAKSDFVATMSHELRTPMNGVIGMIGVLEHSKLDANQARMLGLARDSACSLLEIIENILDFSKIEAGRLDLECAPFSVTSVVAKTIELVSGMSSSRSVNLSSVVERTIPMAVQGDALRLRQVLVNLIGNAIKFSSGGGRTACVTVSVSVHSLEASRVVLEFAVEDNGIGMEKATVASLFKPFVQAEASTTRRFGGTGLGLTISRRFVELMGGEIRVRSEPAVGSVFTVSLPFDIVPASALEIETAMEEVPLASIESPRREAAVLRPELILVAEDNVINQQVIALQLQLLGFAAEIAGNGLDALVLWRSGRFALLLTDLQMPEMDGFGLTACIRSEEGSETRTPIVALTANALKGEDSRCKAAGMDAYLTKPVRLPTLEAMLERFLGARPRIGPDLSLIAPAFTPGPARPVDASVLVDLVGDDPTVLAEFMTDFATAAAAACGELEEAVATGHADKVASVAHRLKSAARSIGALRLGDCCEDIEAAGLQALHPELHTLLPLFNSEVSLVRAWIDMNYPRRQPLEHDLMSRRSEVPSI